jgi:hypothetical protein
MSHFSMSKAIKKEMVQNKEKVKKKNLIGI